MGSPGATGGSFISASVGTEVSASLHVSGAYSHVRFESLPTTDPGIAGQIWSNSGVLTVSSG